MTPQESWNFLVQQHNSKFAESESVVQSDWENYFADGELFGYSRILGEVDAHRKLHIGSSEREIPDVILRKENQDLFVVELKQYSLPKNPDFEKQLLNYMNHTDLHLSVGILVCNAIYVYFYNFSENSQISLEIPFTPDNPGGIKFVELFSKSNFVAEKIRDFIEERNKSAKNKNLIQDELKSPDFIKNLLKKYFAEKGLEKEFDEVWKNYEVKVTEKHKNLEIPQFNLKTDVNFRQDFSNSSENPPEVIFFISDQQVSSSQFKQKLLQTKCAERTWIYKDGREEKDFWDASKFSLESNLLGNIHSTKYRHWKTSGLKKIICSISD